jgi:hypothetical protein
MYHSRLATAPAASVIEGEVHCGEATAFQAVASATQVLKVQRPAA